MLSFPLILFWNYGVYNFVSVRACKAQKHRMHESAPVHALRFLHSLGLHFPLRVAEIERSDLVVSPVASQ